MIAWPERNPELQRSRRAAQRNPHPFFQKLRSPLRALLSLRVALYSNQLRRDGIDESAAVVDEDKLISYDVGEAFAGEMGGTFAALRAEEVQGNAVLGAESEGDAFEAAGLGIERFGLAEGMADGLDL